MGQGAGGRGQGAGGRGQGAGGRGQGRAEGQGKMTNLHDYINTITQTVGYLVQGLALVESREDQGTSVRIEAKVVETFCAEKIGLDLEKSV
jgi:hypothetical protein